MSTNKIKWKGIKDLPMGHARTKQHAHELIDRMAPGQVCAVVGLLEIMLDPLASTLANAPFDDELETEDERQAVAASRTWLEKQAGQVIPNEDVLAAFGLSSEDFERLGRDPLPPEPPVRACDDV